MVRNHAGGTRCAALAGRTRRVAQAAWEWPQRSLSEEGNHSMASEGDVARTHILDAEMFDRGRGKDQEGRQPTMQTVSREENTEDPEEPVGNDEGQEGSREDHRATTCSLGRQLDRSRLQQEPRPWRFPTP